jgi:hypothetical protein
MYADQNRGFPGSVPSRYLKDEKYLEAAGYIQDERRKMKERKKYETERMKSQTSKGSRCVRTRIETRQIRCRYIAFPWPKENEWGVKWPEGIIH